jgi:hypothetical protein
VVQVGLRACDEVVRREAPKGARDDHHEENVENHASLIHWPASIGRGAVGQEQGNR